MGEGPFGAVLAGTKEFLSVARRYKQLFGGSMRQAGIAAAGCLYALDHHVDRLVDDHENARILANGLAEIDGIHVRTRNPESNMVFFDVSGLDVNNDEFLLRLAKAHVRMSMTGREVRAVTHLNVSRKDIETVIVAVRNIACGRDTGS